MKRPIVLVFVILFFFMIALLLYKSLFYYEELETKVIYADVIIPEGNVLGFDVNTSALRFGRVPMGGSSKKTITIENEHAFPVVVLSYYSGNISEFISLDKSSFILMPGSATNVSVFLSIPQNAQPLFYEGYLAFKFYRRPLLGAVLHKEPEMIIENSAS